MISAVSPDDVQMYAELRAVGYEILLVSPDFLLQRRGGRTDGRRPDWRSARHASSAASRC